MLSKDFKMILSQTKQNMGSEFYKRLMKSFSQNNNIEMYSTHNEGKPAVAERFIRTSKYEIYTGLEPRTT